MTIKRTRYAIYDTNYHLVWALQYRRWIMREDFRQCAAEVLREIAAEFQREIEEMEVAKGHFQWKDRLLQSPRCQSHDIDSRGTYHYRPGCKLYWCNSCKRTFNDLTDALLHQSKRSLSYWILATFLPCLACSPWHMAREVGYISGQLSVALVAVQRCLSYEMHRQLEGMVEALRCMVV
jgi:transposase-like protein